MFLGFEAGLGKFHCIESHLQMYHDCVICEIIFQLPECIFKSKREFLLWLNMLHLDKDWFNTLASHHKCDVDCRLKQGYILSVVDSFFLA